MSVKRSRTVVVTSFVVLFFGVGLAACGGGGDDSAATTTSTTAAPATTTTTAAVFDPGDNTTTTAAAGDQNDQQAAIADFMNSVGTETGTTATGDTYTFESISDDTGQLTVDAPTEWSDVDGRVATLGNLTLPDLRASTDVEAYNTTFDVPGFEFRATSDSTTGDPRAVLNEYAQRTGQSCDDQGVQAYSDPLYTGVSQIFTNCGTAGASFVWTVVQPIDTTDGDYIAVVGVQILSDADIDALGRILETFVVSPQ